MWYIVLKKDDKISNGYTVMMSKNKMIFEEENIIQKYEMEENIELEKIRKFVYKTFDLYNTFYLFSETLNNIHYIHFIKDDLKVL
jgi:hypothetical protein